MALYAIIFVLVLKQAVTIDYHKQGRWFRRQKFAARSGIFRDWHFAARPGVDGNQSRCSGVPSGEIIFIGHLVIHSINRSLWLTQEGTAVTLWWVLTHFSTVFTPSSCRKVISSLARLWSHSGWAQGIIWGTENPSGVRGGAAVGSGGEARPPESINQSINHKKTNIHTVWPVVYKKINKKNARKLLKQRKL